MLEKRQEADVRELNKALNEFRMMHQQPDGRREFDLYDPDYLKKDKPARVHDDDPRLTISGKIKITQPFKYYYLKGKKIVENNLKQD